MRSVRRTSRFRRDYRRERRSGQSKDVDAELGAVLRLLLTGEPLPAGYGDHALSGEWSRYRDCHIRPDLILIYRVTAKEVVLVRLGSHSELGL